jgi:hypothetical protein
MNSQGSVPVSLSGVAFFLCFYSSLVNMLLFYNVLCYRMSTPCFI